MPFLLLRAYPILTNPFLSFPSHSAFLSLSGVKMAWWLGETSSKIVLSDDGSIRHQFSYEDQFALFASEDFKAKVADPATLKALLAGLPENLTKPLIVAAYKALGATFSDPNFPPDRSSLYSELDTVDMSNKIITNSLVWKRLEELYPGDKKVFDSIEPNDIKQGMLGDCYFLSSLSALAEIPIRIQRMFDTADYDYTGCYKLKMYDMGRLSEIIVDDFFPVDPNSGELAFSGPKVDRGVTELWVILLEKAWAKRFGSYWRVDAGYTNEALTDLTGAPSEVLIKPQPTPQTWRKIVEADQRNFVITGSSKENASSSGVNEQGMVSLHAYAVIAAKEILTKTGKEQMLQIRNPWGGTEWNGDWSDGSALWTPELKKELGWSRSDDGKFWMNLKDFCKNYDEVVICHVHDDYQISNLAMTQRPGVFSVVQVSLSSPGQFYVMINQQDAKRFPGEEYAPSPVRMVVAKIGANSELEFVKGRMMDLRDSWLDIDGTEGDYLIYFQVDWVTELTDKVGFSVYSALTVNLAEVTAKYSNFLQRVYTKKFAMSLPGQQVFKEAKDVIRYSVKRQGLDPSGELMEGYLVDVFENSGQKQRADIIVMHPKLENVELMAPFAGKEYRLTVHSNEVMTVVKRVVDPREDVVHQVKIAVKLVKT